MNKDKLKEYKNKRNFNKTLEPQKNSTYAKTEIFVIQKHDASNLHYDFRIEIDGVLKSWAIPKGPSTNPKDKRLALLTEDHPLQYAEFEGKIPEDAYGGGTIIVWDGGKYSNLRDDKKSMKESFDEGKIEIELKGKKLSGGYVLIRTDKQGKKWLLKKLDDDEADARRKPLKTEPKSILSDKTIDELEKDMDNDEK